ncbi:ABC transporter ATP-binding protein [Metabacillus bambusae]|uniref:ABC transporter ATP-binding protein n=1 Tax=Metabacillus bambusae TaxID=2795218 RepID=A0ABS3N6R0_9BACI|nr:ABC transporter ATP-binding protein [Metabacillus bambusae]MBO1513730.1 ABC transporter ATP-binding protein [Metabacillus bambusae]
MSFLIIDGVTYSYENKKQIIKDTTWKIKEGEFYSLLGRSGCGKTTLLKIASGLLQPDQGAVFLQGKKVLKPSPEVGFVFQAPTLLEWKTVIDNVLLPISLKRKPTIEERERASSLLKLMKLDDYHTHYPTELSGGQQSRVAIARALIKNPSMLFLDEPFAALDAMTREELQDDLLTLCQNHKITVLFITHDISEAVYLSDHVAVMIDGQIAYDLKVTLPKPRKGEIRYSSTFNALCLTVRNVMNGGMI